MRRGAFAGGIRPNGIGGRALDAMIFTLILSILAWRFGQSFTLSASIDISILALVASTPALHFDNISSYRLRLSHPLRLWLLRRITRVATPL